MRSGRGMTMHESDDEIRALIPGRRSVGRIIGAVFWVLAWAFGLALFSMLLTRLINTATPAMAAGFDWRVLLLLVATAVLLGWVVLWFAGGMFLLWNVLLGTWGVERHVITRERWVIERRLWKARVVEELRMAGVMNVRPASSTGVRGLVMRDASSERARNVGVALHARPEDMRALLEAVRRLAPDVVDASERG